MASAVVTSVAKKLGDLLIQEALFLDGVDDDVQWIRTELTRMQCFLKDADSRSEKKDEGVKNWVAEIIDVSYCAEDVIETFICSQSELRKRRGSAEWVKRCVCIICELICELITRHNIGKQIERIKLKINDISTSRQTFGIRDINEGRQEASSSTSYWRGRRRLSTALQESEVVGLQEEMNAVRVQLIKGEQRRCVVSIVGMGGSGKTTLAKKIYHDAEEDFDCRAFIYLSQQYEIKEILMNILLCVKSLSPEEIEKIEKMNVEELGMMLRDHLREKKYLVVIDDIWSIEAWDAINPIFPDGASQSRVMLTTRNKEVALHADPSSRPHDMRLLNDDEGWELFMKKIFPAACPIHLEKTGRKILAKCGGLPLAISVLGGLLARKDKTLGAWSRVLESVNWHLNESSEKCMEILALSYWDLPLYLKPCFLYFGLFPEDYKISSGRLIRLWIAEGFIQQRGNEILEDIAEDYLDDLVGRSMIQVASRKSNGSVGKCCIHDLLHDLSISEARQNNFFTIHNDKGTSSSSTSVRRLALHCNIGGYENRNRSTVTLRSILSFLGHEVDWEKLHNTCGKLLRVVDALDVQIVRDKFPKEVREFVLLRYLELGFYTKVSLPSSIGNLYNLETLRLSGCGTLPNAICNLKQLRHLCTYGFDIDEPKLDNLRNLQTLCLTAGHWINDELGELTNLRKLGIDGDLSSYHEALSNSILKLWNLRSLKLFRGCSIPPFMPFRHHFHLYKMLLEGRIEEPLEIPPNLVQLTLMGCKPKQDVISVPGKLINVFVIPPFSVLRYCHLGRDQKRRMKSRMLMIRTQVALHKNPRRSIVARKAVGLSLPSPPLHLVPWKENKFPEEESVAYTESRKN